MAIEPLTPERRRQQTRDYLLQAAAQVFAERGFHGASLDEVAAAAGFTKGAVYSNFKNKEDLFLALLGAHHDREMEALHATIESSDIPPEARLTDFVELIRDQARELGDQNWDVLYLEFVLYAMRNPAARQKLTEFDAVSIGKVAELIETEQLRQGATVQDVGHVATIIFALFRGIGLMRGLDSAAVDDEFLEAAMSFLARGLLSPFPETWPGAPAAPPLS